MQIQLHDGPSQTLSIAGTQGTTGSVYNVVSNGGWKVTEASVPIPALAKTLRNGEEIPNGQRNLETVLFFFTILSPSSYPIFP
jgi:hypothetical protein